MTRPARSTAARAIIDINMLPAGHRPVEISALAAVIGVAVVVAMLALVPLAFRLSAARANADAEGERARVAEQSLRAVQIDLASHRGLDVDLHDVQRQLDDLHAKTRRMQGGARPLWEDFSAVLRADLLPPGARVSAVTGTETGLRVQGVAAGPLDAISYAGRLVKDGGFTSAQMASFAPGASGGQFTVEVKR